MTPTISLTAPPRAKRTHFNEPARSPSPLTTSGRRCSRWFHTGLAVCSVLLLAAFIYLWLHLGTAQPVRIIQNAVCSANAGQINCNSAGLGGITKAANALISPILVALFAIAPIAALIGAGAVMFGHRRGVVIVAAALGALILAGAVKGIVA
jgi:hypothetical protein